MLKVQMFPWESQNKNNVQITCWTTSIIIWMSTIRCMIEMMHQSNVNQVVANIHTTTNNWSVVDSSCTATMCMTQCVKQKCWTTRLPNRLCSVKIYKAIVNVNWIGKVSDIAKQWYITEQSKQWLWLSCAQWCWKVPSSRNYVSALERLWWKKLNRSPRINIRMNLHPDSTRMSWFAHTQTKCCKISQIHAHKEATATRASSNIN